MLRESKDVFSVFTRNIIPFAFKHDALNLAEAIVHFMFLDLTNSSIDTKLTYLVYEIISREYKLQESEKQEEFRQYEKKFKDELFKELIKSLEAK